jgi:hypothetical protein
MITVLISRGVVSRQCWLKRVYWNADPFFVLTVLFDKDVRKGKNAILGYNQSFVSVNGPQPNHKHHLAPLHEHGQNGTRHRILMNVSMVG